MMRAMLNACTAWIAAASLLAPTLAVAQPAQVVTAEPQTAASGFSADVATYFRDPAQDAPISDAQFIDNLRAHVKYVFVVFQENRSFDHYYGTFPGANGLFSQDGATKAGTPPASNTQTIINIDGTPGTISPFRIGTEQNAADLDDIDHGHPRMAAKMNVPSNTGTPLMDRFALDEQAKYFPGSPINPTQAQMPAKPSLRSKQFGELAMAYVDCDTVPFMWSYANRFVLFDDIFQTTIGPSTPNAIAMISGQAGETQWVKHPDATSPSTFGSISVPITNDPIPLWGTRGHPGAPPQATNIAPPHNTAPPPAPQDKVESGAETNVAPNLTFASLPLTLAGRAIDAYPATDANAPGDLADVQNDLSFIRDKNGTPVAWGWYQNGYDAEPGLPAANGIAATPHASYIGHHNGPQYFGYVSNSTEGSSHLHGLGDFFTDVANKSLPSNGGVFYVRGGYDNIAGLAPDTSHADNPADANYIAANFMGDDDHPAYSDSQISEALLARTVNAVAASPYWNQSAIVVTYDESEGDYDHVPPRILSWDPAGLPLSRGPRIPLLLISPYARTHVVSHEEGDHNSVIALLNTLFGLPPLATLPDEADARIAGQAPRFATAGVTQTNLGPHDANTPGMGMLLSAFDPARLAGTAPPLPPAYATIDAAVINTLPHYNGRGCAALGMIPMDTQLGITTTVPSDFSARPSQTKN